MSNYFKIFKKLFLNEDIKQELDDPNLPPERVQEIYSVMPRTQDNLRKIVNHPQTPPEILKSFVNSKPYIKDLIKNPNAPMDVLLNAVKKADYDEIPHLFENPGFIMQMLEDPQALHTPGYEVARNRISEHPQTPAAIQQNLAFNPKTHQALSANPKLDPLAARHIFNTAQQEMEKNKFLPDSHRNLAKNPNLPDDLIEKYKKMLDLPPTYHEDLDSLVDNRPLDILSNPKISKSEIAPWIDNYLEHTKESKAALDRGEEPGIEGYLKKEFPMMSIIKRRDLDSADLHKMASVQPNVTGNYHTIDLSHEIVDHPNVHPDSFHILATSKKEPSPSLMRAIVNHPYTSPKTLDHIVKSPNSNVDLITKAAQHINTHPDTLKHIISNPKKSQFRDENLQNYSRARLRSGE